MIRMMQTVVDSGTGRRLRSYGIYNELAGKTGTTQKSTDAWFMGFSPSLIFGCWVGAEDPSVKYVGHGSSAALPICGLFLQQMYKDPTFKELRRERFEQVDSALIVQMNCDLYEAPDTTFIDNLIDFFDPNANRDARQEERRRQRKERREERRKRRERLLREIF